MVRDAVIAVRGDRLSLARTLWRNADGFEIPQLSIGELDAEGRCSALVSFDDDALDAAMAELDARYRAGEGAELFDRR